MAAAVNKDALHLLLLVGGGSESKLSGRGGRCGGVILGVAFMLGPRRRGDAGSGGVAWSWSLFRSLLRAGFLDGLAWWGSAEVGWRLRLPLWPGLETASTSRRWIGDGFPTDACSSASIPARPDVPCGASTQLTAINPRLAMGVDRSRLPLLRRSLGGVGLWIRRARWLSSWTLGGVFVISSLSGSVLLFFQISCIGMFPGCECVRALCISFSV
jgi:hypothetical protein